MKKRLRYTTIVILVSSIIHSIVLITKIFYFNTSKYFLQIKSKSFYFACFSFIAACAAAKRAIGTLNGEHET